MMTILIDCRFAALHVGLGRYARELIVHLLKRNPAFRYVLLVRSEREEWIPSSAETIVADIPHYSLREQTDLPRLIRESGADLLFSPHFNVPLFCPVPFVVTVHDLILHRYPNNASWIKQAVYRCIIAHAVKKAEAVIAVSDFTARELADVYGTSVKNKTTVIREGVSDAYHPVSDHDAKKALEKFTLDRPYFLYVGNAKQHKNVSMLIEAFNQSGVTDCDLILVSGGEEMKKLILPANVRVLSSVSDEDLPALYSAARCTVTASLYEGYCLPVAEALACGCPVIATNRTAIPEIADGHSMLIEPTIEAFAQAFKHPPKKTESVIVGTWERAAEETEAILRSLI